MGTCRRQAGQKSQVDWLSEACELQIEAPLQTSEHICDSLAHLTDHVNSILTLVAVALVAGQFVAALVLDHFGLPGFARQTVTSTRAAGAVLLFAGVYLIQRR